MEYSKDFDKAESLMQDYPKDALALLDSIKQYPIKSKAANARFALLYSQALDKNYVDVTDDSLISIAENWYSKKGSVREKFLSHYHKGVVNKNAKNYPEAIAAFSRAQKLEKEMDDYYLLGLLYNQMGAIYNKHYEYNRALEAFTRAYNLYEQAGKTNHKNYIIMRIAGCYWNIGDYSNSEKYYKKAINEGEKSNYRVLTEQSVINLIGQYIEQERYNEAALLNEIYKSRIKKDHPIFEGNIARLYYVIGKVQDGAESLENAWQYAKTQEDSIALYINEYYIYNHLGNLGLSLDALEKADKLKSQSVSLKLKQPVLEIQKKLLEKELEYSTYKLETDRKITFLACVILAVLISITIFFFRNWIKEKEKKLKSYVCLLSELQDTLQHLQIMLQNKDIKLNSAYANAADIISYRLNLINNLSVTLYERRGTPKSKEIFIKEVEMIIEDFKTSEKDVKWMEQVINGANNNLLEKIYANYPTLSEDEKKLLCYVYAGFSPKAISVFLEISIETVYNRKSRLLAKTGLSKSKN